MESLRIGRKKKRDRVKETEKKKKN